VSNLVKRFIYEEKGQGMVEYGLILALVAVVVIVALTSIGTQISAKFTEIATKLGATPTP
jgi:pilus assembly protein Flp/PilA